MNKLTAPSNPRSLLKMIFFMVILFPTLISAQDLEFSIPFSVTDGVNTLELTVAVSPEGSSTEFVEGLDALAPPAPPDGAFDARMKVNGTSYFTKHFDNSMTEKTATFEYSPENGEGPIVISWDAGALSAAGTFTITDTFNGSFFTQSMNDLGGSFTVPSPGLIQGGFNLVFTPSEDGPPEPPGGLSFAIPFGVSDGVNSLDLTVGVDPNGSSTDFVEELDALAPPAPPDGAFDARMKVNGTSYFTKYFDNSISEKTATFEYVAESGEGPIVITWDAGALSAAGTFTITDTFNGSFFTQNLNDLDGSFTVPSPGLIQSGFNLVFTPFADFVDVVANAPVFSPAGGTYEGSVEVSMSTTSPGADIFYTLDGSDPTTSSTLYAGPISIAETTTVKAVAGGPEYLTSEISMAIYTIEGDEPPGELSFAIPFAVSDGVNSLNLTVGVDPNGSSTDFVEELDALAPPAPPDGAFDARMKVNGTSYFTKYFDNSITEKTATFEYSAESGEGPIVITWDAEALSAVGTFTITDTFNGTFFTQSLNDLDGSFTVPSPGLIQDGFNLVFTPSGEEPPNPPSDPVAATPVFSPAGGTYTGSVEVSISTTSAGASVYYTLDGSTPTTASTQYTGPISLSETTTVKAIAGGTGFTNSAVTEATYTIEGDEPPGGLTFTLPFNVSDGVNDLDLTVGVDPNGSSTDFVEGLDQLAPPAPPDGAFDARMKVNGTSYFTKYFDNSISEKTATFEYVAESGEGPIVITWDAEALSAVGTFTITDTFNGTFFTQSLNDLDGSFTVPSPGLIQDGFSLVFTPSGNGVDPIAATPVFTPAGGTYNGSVDVTLSASSAGTSIYYTLDGTDPTSASTQYNGPISLSETTTVKAIASGEGFRDSQIATAEYIITNDFVFTLAFYVTDGVNSQNLIIGSDPGANSTAYVEELDQLAPPAPPDGAFDARLKVNGTSYFAKYFDNQLVENTARFEFSASNGNGPIELYWDAEALDIVGTFTIEDTFGGTIFSQDVSELNGFFAVPESGVISDAFNLVFTPNGEETDPIASTPVIMPEGGSSMVYEESVDVTITAETPGSSIYYTTDGSVPDTDSNLYTSTLTLTESSTVKAIAVANGFRQSFIAETKYVVKQRAETPQISPEAGTYVENVSVTISTGSEGANIYYTLDGSTPNEQSAVYDGPLSVSSSLTVKAIAGGGEFLPSDVVEAAYEILIIAEAPVVSPDAGTYVDEVEITLSTPTEGASIFYTLDGSDPTVESSQYEGALVLTESTTVKAIAGGVGFVTSDIVEAVYEVLITAEQPMIFPESGTYVDVVEISMSTQTDGASIWYTTDGSTPTPNANSQLYTEAFSITESATVKAIAGGEGFATSEVTEAEYEVLITAEAPLFSAVAGTYADSVEVTLSSETPGVSIYYTTDGEDPSTGSTLYTSPLLITETTTLKAIAAGDGYVTSDVSEAEYLIVDYYLDMQVSDENSALIVLRVGTAGDASTIFNPLYDQLAPPPPPDGAFDARVKVDGVSYFTKYQPTIETVREWSLEFAPSSGGAPITITWDPAQLSSEGTFTLRDVVNGMFVDVDMRAQSELVVSDAFITELTLSHKLFVEIDQDYLFNWNLVSVPVVAEDNGYQSLFPLASEGTLFSFSVNYEAQETLEPGKGYWLRMDEDDTVTFTGEEISSSTLNLQANWNIIGSISEESVIEDPDQIVVPGTLFGFGINYVAEDRVESGRGYWLATFEAGDVTLVPSGGAGLAGAAGADIDVSATSGSNSGNAVVSMFNPVRSPEVLDRFRSLRFVRGDGKLSVDESQSVSLGEVYFGGSFDRDVHPLQMQLPPVPPAGSFDVRTEEHGWISEESSVLVRFQSSMVSEQHDGTQGSNQGNTGEVMQTSLSIVITEGARVGANVGTEGSESDGYAEGLGDGLGGTVAYRVQFLDAQRQPLSPVQVMSGVQMGEFDQSYKQGSGHGSEYIHDGVGNQALEVPAGTAWISVEIVAAGDELPAEFALGQNYPNPFNPSTTIEYALPEVADVRLEVYNMLGQRVATLVDAKQQAAGSYNVVLDASNLSSGMYIYRITAGNFTQTRKMMLIK